MTRRLPLLLLLLLAGCLAGQVDRMKDQRAAGDLAGLASTQPGCAGPDPLCLQAQMLRAEACLALALAAPRAPAATGQRACAEQGYQAAIAALVPGDPHRRAALAGWAAAAMARRDAGEADATAQGAAGRALLALDPADAIGCTHARSAQLATALMQPRGPGRCAALRAAPACAANPALDRQIAAQAAACAP